MHMPSTIPELPEPRRLITRDEYWEMYYAGYFNGKKVELLGGEIVEMSPQTNWHVVGISNVEDALKLVFDPSQFWVRNQSTLDLSPLFVPDPDVSVVVGSKKRWSLARDNPTTAVLIVEVSETTVWEDRARKGSLYAAAGINDYWILNIPNRQLEIRRDPQPDSTQRFGYGYATLITLVAGDFAAPLAAPTARIPVDDLFPN